MSDHALGALLDHLRGLLQDHRPGRLNIVRDRRQLGDEFQQ
jgi:hypothetical protein